MNGTRRLWLAVMILGMLVGTSWVAAPTTQAAQPPISTLVAIRAAYHAEASPRYDRVVFEFRGPVPLIEVQYVKRLIGDGSGLPVAIAGNAILQLRMTPAQAHTDQGQPTAPTRIKLSLPNVKAVVSAGDFEAVLTYGIGVARKSEIRVRTLDNPSRVVVDFLNR